MPTLRATIGPYAVLPLRLIPKSTVVPILMGPNRGYRWIVGSGIHRSWIGFYERDNARFLNSAVLPGMTVFDVGAHSGYFSLLFARLVGPSGKVLAFEPDPANLANLRRHQQLNEVFNLGIVDAAVASKIGSLKFDPAGFMGRVSENGRHVVRATKLDLYPTPDFIKMDIEGAELDALAGAERILSERRTGWFIETHGQQALDGCQRLFANLGYAVRAIGVNHIYAEASNALGNR